MVEALDPGRLLFGAGARPGRAGRPPEGRSEFRRIRHVHIAVHFDVQSEHREDFIAAALEDGRNSDADEPGTRRFELIVDEDNPNRFYLNEAYDDAAAFDLHAKGPHFARFFELISDYVEGPPWLIKGTLVEDEVNA